MSVSGDGLKSLAHDTGMELMTMLQIPLKLRQVCRLIVE